MRNLFLFTFEIPTVSMDDKIQCSVYAEDYELACYITLKLGLPISITEVDELSTCIKEVLQITDEAPESN